MGIRCQYGQFGDLRRKTPSILSFKKNALGVLFLLSIEAFL
jgi:hypothetical protein